MGLRFLLPTDEELFFFQKENLAFSNLTLASLLNAGRCCHL